jgi:hypothetical protein
MEGALTGADLRKLRKRSGLSLAAFAVALGYTGNHRNLRNKMIGYEKWEGGRLPEPVVLRAEGFELSLAAESARSRRHRGRA